MVNLRNGCELCQSMRCQSTRLREPKTQTAKCLVYCGLQIIKYQKTICDRYSVLVYTMFDNKNIPVP